MSVKLPKQVQDAEDRANEAIRAAQEQRDKPAEVPPANPAPAPVPSKDEDRQDWKSKYLVLQGKYNAEVPRLHADVKELKEQVQALTEKAAKAAVAPPPPAPKPPNPADLADSAKFGEDTVSMVRRLAAEAAAQAAGEVRDELTPVKSKVDEVASQAEAVATNQANARRVAFMAELTKAVPNWREIDQDDAFQAFLAEHAPQTRTPRQKFLEEAYADGDVLAVAGFFNAFTASKAPAALPGSNPLERHVVPDPSGRSAPGSDKKIWTKVEISHFYSEVAKGRVSAAKADEIGKEIDAAAREGRVR